MSRSVLCAIDIANANEEAKILLVAKKLADLDGAQLDLVTVVPNFGFGVVAGFFKEGHHDKMVTEAKAHLEAFTTETIGAEASKNVRYVVATGAAYDEILSLAAKIGCGLIVMGAHKPELTDHLIGPNADRVVRHAECSVHVVR